MSAFLDLHGKTNKLVRALADAGMRRHGLHLGQNHLLAALWERDGQTPGEIAAALEVSAPTVVKMATRMASAGLIARRRGDDSDRRLIRLWLTPAGRALQKPIRAEREALEKALMQGLSRTERAVLLRALGKVYETAGALLAAGGTVPR